MGTIREGRRKDGSLSYHAEVRLKGHSSQRASFRTRSLAKKWVQDTESAIRDGRHFRTAESKRHTLADLIERFFKEWLPKFPQRQVKQTALLTWWKKRYGHILLADLTPAVIAEGRDELLNQTTVRKTQRNPSTVNRYLSALGRALTIGVKEWGWLEENPIRNVSKPSESRGRERFLSLSEKERLLEQCRLSRNPNLYPIVALALLTGMRQGELINLHWENVDFERNRISLWKTKNGDSRQIPLTPEMEKVFRDCRSFGSSSNTLVFPPIKKTVTAPRLSIREAFEAALKRAGIQNFRFHDLRHTAASYIAMSGATQGELQALFGWKSPQMTKRYAHFTQEHLRKILSKNSLKHNQD